LDYPDVYVMTEFVLGNRRLRLYPDGKITLRARCRGKETKQDTWNELPFFKNKNGYLTCSLTINGGQKGLYKHRLLHLARNPGWDIFDSSRDNYIDHINNSKDDNTDGNLRVVTHQQNTFNTNAKGYTWHKIKNKWQAQICVNQQRMYIGLFEKEEDAAAAYLEAKARLHVIPVS